MNVLKKSRGRGALTLKHLNAIYILANFSQRRDMLITINIASIELDVSIVFFLE